MFPEDELHSGFVVEQDLRVPVADAWAALLGLVGPSLAAVGGERAFTLDEWALVERTTELEPPVRRVYRIVSGAPVRSYVGTSELTATTDGCRLRWQVEVEPGDEPVDAFLARAEMAVRRGIEVVVAAVS